MRKGLGMIPARKKQWERMLLAHATECLSWVQVLARYGIQSKDHESTEVRGFRAFDLCNGSTFYQV